MKTVGSKHGRAHDRRVTSHSNPVSWPFTINNALSTAVDIDISASEAPKKTNTLVRILKGLGGPNADVVVERDVSIDGKIDMIEECEVKSSRDLVLAFRHVNSSTLVTALCSHQDFWSSIC